MERIKAIMEAYGCSLEEALEREEDTIVLDLDSPTEFDLGYYYIDSFGGISEMSRSTLERYFNYDALGNDLVLSGDFVITKDGKGVSMRWKRNKRKALVILYQW